MSKELARGTERIFFSGFVEFASVGGRGDGGWLESLSAPLHATANSSSSELTDEASSTAAGAGAGAGTGAGSTDSDDDDA